MTAFPFPKDQPVLSLVEVLEVLDPEKMQAYVAGIAPQMEAIGARNIASGFHSVVGTSEAINMVAAVFPSVDAYEAWQQSEAYAPFKPIREAAVRIRTHLLPLAPEVYAKLES